jgi:hypothetical protein
MIAKNGEQFGEATRGKPLISRANLTKAGRIICHEREAKSLAKKRAAKEKDGLADCPADWECGICPYQLQAGITVIFMTAQGSVFFSVRRDGTEN